MCKSFRSGQLVARSAKRWLVAAVVAVGGGGVAAAAEEEDKG